MKTYITKEQRDSSKTYNKYVDVLIRYENRETRFLEKVTANTKADILDVIYRFCGKNKMKSYEIKSTFFRLKEKWLYE